MPGFSPQLPLNIGPIDGYNLNISFRQMAQQNLKMVIMTNPGERIMIPEFGVGIRTYLFENSTQATFDTIEDKIRQQVGRYLPYISIETIQFGSSETGFNMSEIDPSTTSSFVSIQIKYNIPSAFISGVLILEI
jgi:phage baseplate assembly protein W